MIKEFKKARKVSVPIVAISTFDPGATMRGIAKSFKEAPALLCWDIIRGFSAVNKAGEEAIDLMVNVIAQKNTRQGANGFADGNSEKPDPSSFTNPGEALQVAADLPSGAILFFLNAHRYMNLEPVSQGIWNLRDVYKRDGRMLVLLSPGMTIPPELSQDLILLDEQVPDAEQVKEIIQQQYKNAKFSEAPDEFLNKAVDAVRGLSTAFVIEQVTAMNLDDQTKGLDLDSLWNYKRRMIEATRGLGFWKGGETFAQIGGLENIKQFLSRILKGKNPPGSIVLVDEGEKSIAGATNAIGDSSGVSQDFLGTWLRYMQDTEATGMIFNGVAGGGKSFVAKASGTESGIPVLTMDVNAMKDSLVGASEAYYRQAFKVVGAVSNGRPLFILTCNNVNSLPPELRRRFTLGIWFFDLLSAEERETIWDMYLSRFKIPEQARPNDQGWTGAEIKTCCDIAWRLDISLQEASKYVVPVSQSGPEIVEAIRRLAHGRFISSSYSGVYMHPRIPVNKQDSDTQETRLILTQPAEV